MDDEGANLVFVHFARVAFAVEEDVAFDPVFVGLFGAVGVVFGAQGVADLVHEFFGFWGWVDMSWFYGVSLHCISSAGGAKIQVLYG